MSVFEELLKTTKKTQELKEELTSILENLEESIIIISNCRAEFVN
jgi:CRISPR/Cas system-associated endoribonuclease Cas2